MVDRPVRAVGAAQRPPDAAAAAAAEYQPRRSARVGDGGGAPADGDTWRETLSVCEGATAAGAPRLLVRSRFTNDRTQERAWDEPPSGASSVRFASAEQRARAQAKLAELQQILDMIPPDEEEDARGSQQPSPASKERKGGIFRNFGKRKEKSSPQINEAQDINLQRAIARSMADFQGRPGSDDPVVYFDSENPDANAPSRKDDDDVALAKALSISESTHKGIANMSEEEQLQLALEQSRLDAERSGGGPFPTGRSQGIKAHHAKNLSSPSDFDRKKPAEERQNPFETPPATPTKLSTSTFDPYSPDYTPSPVHARTSPGATGLPSLATSSPQTGAHHGQAPESGETQQGSWPKRNFGRLIRTGRRKAMEDEAGVV